MGEGLAELLSQVMASA